MWCTQGHNLEATLSAEEGADTMAFVGMIADALAPAWHHYMWLDKKNLSELARPTWAKMLPLPFNYM